MKIEFFPWGFFSLFTCGWLAICFILSHIGGWPKLHDYYPAQEKPPRNAEHYTVSAGMRWGVGYRSCLTISMTLQGIYIRIMFLFRPWQPPLFIPWSDISTSEEKQFFTRVTRFTFAKVPDVPLVLELKVAQKILSYRPA